MVSRHLRSLEVEGDTAAERHSAAESDLVRTSIDLGEASRLTGAPEHRLRRLIDRGDLVAFLVDGDPRIPAWQLQHSEITPVIPAAKQLVRLLPGDLTDLNEWMCRPSSDLAGASPVEALNSGNESRVVALARAVAAAGR